METRVLERPATGGFPWRAQAILAPCHGPPMSWGSSPHSLSPLFVRDVAVHEPADVVRHPADDIHGHNGSCRTGGERQTANTLAVMQLWGRRLPEVTTAFPESFLLESGGWQETLRLPGTLLSGKKVEVKVAQSCPTLCDPMDYTAHGILQARILEWATFLFSRGSSQPRSPALQADSLPTEVLGKPHSCLDLSPNLLLLYPLSECPL